MTYYVLGFRDGLLVKLLGGISSESAQWLLNTIEDNEPIAIVTGSFVEAAMKQRKEGNYGKTFIPPFSPTS